MLGRPLSRWAMLVIFYIVFLCCTIVYVLWSTSAVVVHIGQPR
jgi:hypothetical protein